MPEIVAKMSQVPCYTIINSPDLEVPNEMQLKQDLEKGDTNVKIETLKKVIKLLLNGERYPGLIMTIIRFVLPVQNHTIKKLLLIFWEIVPKTSADGKLLQEMILVCDAYRKVSSANAAAPPPNTKLNIAFPSAGSATSQ